MSLEISTELKAKTNAPGQAPQSEISRIIVSTTYEKHKNVMLNITCYV